MTESESSPVEAIKKFFARDVEIDVYLPDGWAGGRAMENQHDLKSVSLLPGELVVNLGEGFVLTVRGEALSVREIVTTVLWPNGSPAIEISGFKELTFRVPGLTRTYDQGVALFVAGI